ncbi:hypothetical protein [Streptomyces sp. NPDC005859]|uniref:hypothetical protein n=1 Tax=Streptomyces sp. NPDC005859 TaxID=3157170 RepID=UPI0033E9034F
MCDRTAGGGNRKPRPALVPPRARSLLGDVGFDVALAPVVDPVRDGHRRRLDGQDHRDDRGGGQHEGAAGEDVLTPLTVSLITAAPALVVGALARPVRVSRRERYTTSAANGTRSMTSLAKGLAVPALVLGVLMLVAHLVGSPHW